MATSRILFSVLLAFMLSLLTLAMINVAAYVAMKNAAVKSVDDHVMWRVTHKDQVWETSKKVRHWNNTTEFETEDGRQITIVGDAVTEMYSKKE